MDSKDKDLIPILYEEETQTGKLSRKARDSPFMVAGLLGLAGIVGYSFYGLRQRKIPLSLYLIHTRVGAQGFVVTCLTVGIAYNMFKEYVYPMLKDKTSTETSATSTVIEEK